MKRRMVVMVSLAILIMALSSGQVFSAEKMSYKEVTPAEAKALIEKTPDLTIIDVSPAYAKGHLPKAVHYYIGDGSLDKAIPKLDKNKPYLVYCHVDSVSIQGAKKLVDAGFTKVYRLKGNYKAWVDAGYPIEK
jgi:rhodanese-related sulfurtransferase